MQTIHTHIDTINKSGSKALAVFLTAGFPSADTYVDTACSLLDAGADILEIGIPFSDPLADGPIIQQSSQLALDNGIRLKDVFTYCEQIRERTSKKLVAMGYANPILSYGVEKFMTDAASAGFDGLIVPDVPYDEYENFYGQINKSLETILLVTPVTTPERIALVDKKSKGFLYYVSVAGITGTHSWSGDVIGSLQRVRAMGLQNKLMVGFGVSSAGDIHKIKGHCDGVIVGSAIIKRLLDEPQNIKRVEEFVASLKQACVG
ncbi:MAG: tryptophan synthase subunit alpha [Ignavibacteriales bacterium]|nr:tryptophan synthase subunit alpha [Ignavibacteriales bacterium]